MGLSLAWIGIQRTDVVDVQAALGLTETGSIGDLYEFPIAAVTRANGWHLITATWCDHPIRSEPVLLELSSTGSVIACSVEEHVMSMSSALWRNGQEIWSVQHRGGDYGVNDLVVKGAPPGNFDELRMRCFAAQESARSDSIGVDYVADIPVLLAKSIVGFKYDEIDPETEGRFRALRQEPTGLLAKATKPRWKFW